MQASGFAGHCPWLLFFSLVPEQTEINHGDLAFLDPWKDPTSRSTLGSVIYTIGVLESRIGWPMLYIIYYILSTIPQEHTGILSIHSWGVLLVGSSQVSGFRKPAAFQSACHAAERISFTALPLLLGLSWECGIPIALGGSNNYSMVYMVWYNTN